MPVKANSSPLRRRNPVARALQNSALRPRLFKLKTAYDRNKSRNIKKTSRWIDFQRDFS